MDFHTGGATRILPRTIQRARVALRAFDSGGTGYIIHVTRRRAVLCRWWNALWLPIQREPTFAIAVGTKDIASQKIVQTRARKVGGKGCLPFKL